MLGYKTKRDRDLFLLCCLAYSATYICRYNFSSVIPQLTKDGIVSTVAGILNSVAYIGCAAMNRVAGGILQSGSWNTVILFWMILAAVAVAFCLVPQKNKTV